MEPERPRINTVIWIRKNGKVLLGVRNKKIGYGEWCPPGGHLEMNETLEECVGREAREETGIIVQNVKIITFIENIWEEGGSHYISFHYSADWLSGEVTTKSVEFDKLEWFSWENLPSPLFRGVTVFMKKGINPITV